MTPRLIKGLQKDVVNAAVNRLQTARRCEPHSLVAAVTKHVQLQLNLPPAAELDQKASANQQFAVWHRDDTIQHQAARPAFQPEVSLSTPPSTAPAAAAKLAHTAPRTVETFMWKSVHYDRHRPAAGSGNKCGCGPTRLTHRAGDMKTALNIKKKGGGGESEREREREKMGGPALQQRIYTKP